MPIGRRRLSNPRPAETRSKTSEFIAVRTKSLRRVARRNRVLLVTLLVVGGVVAALVGIGNAQGSWYPNLLGDKAPRARFGAASAWDAAHNELVMFGGFRGVDESDVASFNRCTIPFVSLTCIGPLAPPPPKTFELGETWVFKGAERTWGDRTESAIHAPSPRGFAAMAYDAARRNVVLFGGAPYNNSNKVSGETWVWDGKDWTLQNPPKPLPDPRQNAAMVYDAHRKVVVMFGGRGADGKAMNDTWVWNGSAWKIMPRAEGDPSPRHSAAMAYDVCRAQAVMFGGVGEAASSGTHPQPFETWVWNGQQWDPRSPLVSPPPRVGASMAYSPHSGRIFLYGGLIANDAGVAVAAADQDLWRWDQANETWERMNSDATTLADAWCGLFLLCRLGTFEGPAPAPRAYTSFVETGILEGNEGAHFLLYGGTPSSQQPAPAYEDQHEFREFSPTERIAIGIPLFAVDVVAPGTSESYFPNCADPVAISEDALSQIAAPEGPRFEVRDGIQEIGKLPVLSGTDWPSTQRDTHNYGSPPPVNPKYTPPPDCPNRTAGESGENTELFTDPERNRVYQFFLCDAERGYGLDTRGNYGVKPRVYNILIGAYDGTTLKPLGSTVVGWTEKPWFVPFRNAILEDPDRGNFVLRNFANGYDQTSLVILRKDLIDRGTDPVVGNFNVTGMPKGAGSTSFFFNHPKTGRAKMFYALLQVSSLVPGQSLPPKLGQWDLEAGVKDWEVALTGCTQWQQQVTEPALFAMHLGDRVYTVCLVSGGQYGVVRMALEERAGDSEAPGTMEVFSGPNFLSRVWGDRETERFLLHERTGGQKIWVFDGKTSRWVGRSGILAVDDYQSLRWGFDEKTGRLYAHTSDIRSTSGSVRGGVFMLDTRLTPVPQALSFPQFAAPPGAEVVSLPAGPGVPRRVFIRVRGGNMRKHPNWETVEFENEMHYRVLADEIPIPEVADLSQQDVLTVPVAETPGKTEVSFDAEGSGYGIRLRSIGGLWSVARPIASAYGSAGDQVEGAIINARHLMPACAFPDRELIAGFIPQARLSDLDALARSSGLEVDSNSKTDLMGPFSRCNPSAEASNFPPSAKIVFDQLWPLWQMVQFEGNKAASQGTSAETGKDADGKCGEIKQQTSTGEVAISDCTETPAGTISRGKDAAGNPTVRYKSTTSSWDSHFKEVECVGDALKDYRAAVGNIYGSAKCVQTQGKVEAAARGSATGSGPLADEISSRGFSIAEGYSTVSVTREPAGRGVVVTSTAVARGIQLPGMTVGDRTIASLSIDRVETKAVAWSNGRPSDPFENPRATFTRTICGVHTPDGSTPGCLTADQQQTMVNNWNARWGINSKMYLPKPDPDYYQGSPGGYIAGVIKPVADETEDQLFAKDFQKEVPGLEVHFYKDTFRFGNARQTLQLAAVRAVAGLGVQCNPDLIYALQTNDCVALPDDILDEEFFEEDEEEFLEDEEVELDGEWVPVESLGAPGESLGSRIGRFIQNLPVIRQLPIRQMGEALLASSVWVLLGLPLLFAWRRLSLNMEVRS